MKIDIKNAIENQCNGLLRTKSFINGVWVSSENESTFEVTNPFDNSVIANVANLGGSETKKAIDSANEAFKTWSKTTAEERSRLLKKLYQLQLDHIEELAQLLTLEQGKPLVESRGEIKYGASFIEWFAEEAKRTYGDTIPSHGHDKRIITLKQAVGVVAAITPWNFPNAMITRKIAPALAAGCTVVIKPAHQTPLSALALAALVEKAGFPKGVFNVITSDTAKEIGDELTANPIVRKLSFTGSTKVGKTLMRQCSDTVKKVSMELGGNAPFIVFEDANIDNAVRGAIASKYRNAGQTCVCTNRIFVHDNVYQTFVDKFTVAVNKLKMGSGLDEETAIGPLINSDAVTFIDGLVKNAVGEGAKLITGGEKIADKENFYPPTILTNVTNSMEICRNEIFGSIAPIIRFKDEAEVVKMANDTPYGLASYFYSNDYAKIWRVSEGLEYGMVGINTGMISTTVAPFGGIKESGNGREGSKYGMDEYLEIKYVCIGGVL
ncbi:NAD-dependent succinate-semialdehyde dehydrogenase [uncultured Marixanthomonas sp.]|uniref:NAD-dependent succinate-semialdehyde dehydrogenase n=1 Tax=uncultured Marixanthomonas sp. TaxID=757245 RepID=UPI0030DAFCD3|tara:strand:- start:11697 stop:13178 length:1482 start_codon:yes stop_codon:yes gene_type:complete